MSKSKKITLIAAAGCVLAGLVISGLVLFATDFRATKVSMVPLEEKTYEVEEPFQNIEVQDISCDIYLLPAPDGRCRVDCYEGERIGYTVGVQNGTLMVTKEDTRRWWETISIQLWSIGARDESSVTVYLPDKAYQNLHLETVSGEIDVPEQFTFSDAEVSNTNGDISVLCQISGRISVTSINGEIRLENMTGASAEAETTNGSVFLSDLTVKELTASSANGSIYLEDVQVSGTSNLETVNGGISIKHSDSGSYRIETVNGNVTGELLSPKNFVTGTVNGDVEVPASDPTAGSCVIETTNGNIVITYDH